MIGSKDLAEGSFLRKSLSFAMDADSRICVAMVSTERERFAIKDPDPVVIPIPFRLMKEAVAQILTFEAETALAKLPHTVHDNKKLWPQGIQGVMRMAELLMDAAQLEAAGQGAVEANQPSFRPNLDLIVGDGQ